MKLEKTTKQYCKTCKKHTEQDIAISKSPGRSKSHPLSRSSPTRIKARGLWRGSGNKGRYSKPPGGGKRSGAKSSKKSSLRYKCKTCKKSSHQKRNFRAKKVEFK